MSKIERVDDLSSSGSVQTRFELLRGSTYCPFAEGSNIEFGPEWDNKVGIEENVLAHLEAFSKFAVEGDAQELDMYVMEVRGAALIGDIDSMARTLGSVLLTLNAYDDPDSRFLHDGITELAWDFTFLGTEFFIPVFAPFYHNQHPRYSQNPDSAFITFQPDYSFTRHNITSKNPNRHRISENIRDKFARHGSPYDISLIVGTPKAIRYIKPLQIGDEPIQWWEYES